MIVTSWQKRIMITRGQLTVVMWAPCSCNHLTSNECNVVTKCILIILGHFVNQTVLQLAWGIEMINHIYFCHIIAANGVVFARVDISVAMFSFPMYIAVDSSDKLFHDLSRNHAGHQHVQKWELCVKRVGMWNRPETGCPFLPKTTVQI